MLPKRYLLVLEPELPELEPAPLLPELLLGLLGLVVLLGLELLAPPELLPLDEGVAELPLLLEDLKYASHSERDTCPSLFLSTIEKSGVDPLAPPEALPPLEALLGDEDEELLLGVEELPLEALPPLEELPLDMPEEPDEPELPVALGEDLSLPEAPVEDEPVLCAMETLASAKSAAAVAVPTYFSIA